MGNDGGTIPRRIELVKSKKKPQQVDKDAEAAAKWKYCQISQEPLRSPIVACDLGRLYNKDSVLMHLLNKKTTLEGVEHIRGLKDVTELHLTAPSKLTAESPLDEGGFRGQARWVCPITGLEMTGRQLFSFLKKCGCVISDRALKTLKSETCPSCNKPYTDDDVIPLNPGPEQLEKLQYRLELLKNQQKLDKQAVKDSKKRALTEKDDEASTSASAVTVPTKLKKVVPGTSNDSSRPKHSLSNDVEVAELVKKKVAEDPKATAVFKSLFTSSETAQQRDHAHWVTYNPFYN